MKVFSNTSELVTTFWEKKIRSFLAHKQQVAQSSSQGFCSHDWAFALSTRREKKIAEKHGANLKICVLDEFRWIT